MTTLEITLLILGAVIFIASFIIPENKKEAEELDKELVQKELAKMLQEEIKNVHSQVEDTVEETVSYSMERTERALERVTNEKITAVSEYTETVLSDIHKSHEEVMFLYDMLNEKHVNLKETASEVSKTMKEASEVVQEADQAKKEVSMATQALDEALAAATEDWDFEPIDISGIEKLKQAAAPRQKESLQQPEKSEQNEMPKPAKSRKPARTANTRKKKSTPAAKKENSENVSNMSMQFDAGQETAENNNERILELHKKGKSNVAIAKELGLGVGEVKLVIDLFKGI